MTIAASEGLVWMLRSPGFEFVFLLFSVALTDAPHQPTERCVGVAQDRCKGVGAQCQIAKEAGPSVLITEPGLNRCTRMAHRQVEIEAGRRAHRERHVVGATGAPPALVAGVPLR
ncbi:hypothetical protein AAFF_G00203910 [Aldrovandia affinis]|uniref:Secreted protein n=1 Tax=Aldrovandia affinis TaxID=143900 RepID=A0AAD7SXD8_9TELE|nr:hypothetical protein AAFF_G00203910 [Aldrovandia affinis]